MPVAPKRTVFGSTVAALNPLPVRIVTRISLSLLGLILFASPRGLMPTTTCGGNTHDCCQGLVCLDQAESTVEVEPRGAHVDGRGLQDLIHTLGHHARSRF